MNPSTDPSLTSWALNELSQEERAAFEKAMKSEPSLLAEAQATQGFCQFMQIHLQDESAALTDSQRERLRSYASWKPQQAAEVSSPRVQRKSLQPPAWYRRPVLVLPLSVAAAVALTMWFADRGDDSSAPTLADGGPVIITAPVVMQQPEVQRTVLAPSVAQVTTENTEASRLGLPRAGAHREGGAVPASLSTVRTPDVGEQSTSAPTITLMKTGAGEIKLSGVNTYNGTTTITIVDGSTSQSVTTIISTTGATLNSGTIVGTPSGRYVGRSIQELGEARRVSTLPEKHAQP